jgi:hypothetical protein
MERRRKKGEKRQKKSQNWVKFWPVERKKGGSSLSESPYFNTYARVVVVVVVVKEQKKLT